MKSTTSPAFEKLRPERANSDLSISVGDINVGGNVEGNIVVGNRNVIGDNNVICEVHNSHGVVINLQAPPSINRRDVNQQPPRSPRGFVGREYELKGLEQHIRAGEAVLIYGQDGIGKTALVKKAANSEAALSMPDGVLYVEGVDEENILGPHDILQHLFDKLFISNPEVKATDSIVETYLSNTRPLVILDHVELSASSLNRFPDLLPNGALVVSSQNALSGDAYESIHLTALVHEDAIQLFAQKSGVALDASARQIIDPICSLLGDIPLAITKIAQAIHENRLTLTIVANGLKTIRPSSQNNVQSALERSFGLIYSILNREEREMLSITAAAPGKSVDRVWLESLTGGEKTSQALESLELLYSNSPRLRLPEGIKEVLQFDRKNILALRKLLLGHLLDELKYRSLDFNFLADELGNILGLIRWASNEKRWSDVIALGRAVDPYLVLHGLWDAWETVLKQILVAGQNIKDIAVRGWALHQLGTREIGVGSRKQAEELLRRALRIRISQRDMVGAAYTLHNLKIILPPGSTDQPKEPDEPKQEFQSTEQTSSPGVKPHPSFWKEILRFFEGRAWILPAAAALLVVVILGLILRPSLSLDIQANPVRYNPVGQVIEYSYVVDNPGLIRLTGPVFVTDDRTQVRCPTLRSIGNKDNFLDWNETVTCSDFYVITEADVKNGSVTNTAMAWAGEVGPKSKSKSVTITFDPDYVTLSKQADRTTYKNAGETITFAYIITNVGTQALSGPVTVTDDSLKVTCPEINKVGNQDSSLDPSEALTCIAPYTITEQDILNGSVTNTAFAQVGNITSEPQPVTIYAILPSTLGLTKSVDPQTFKDIGEEIRYTYFVTNHGKEPMNGSVTVEDDKTRVACPDVRKVGNQDDLLDPGETLACAASYFITQTDIDRGIVTNTAWAVAGDVKSEPQSTTIYLKMPPPILFKSADRETYQVVGEEIKYTYVISNRSQVPLNGPVTIKDDKTLVTCPDILQTRNQNAILGPGDSLTCTATYTITEADVRNGSVTNTAWTSVGEFNLEPQAVTIYWTPPSTLNLVKSADPEAYEKAGQTIKYSYFITIAGKGSLQGPVTVADDKIQVACPELRTIGNQNDSLEPGELLTCTASYMITEEDIKNGSVTNTGTAVAGNVTSRPSSVTIHEKALVLTKSAAPQSYKTVGQQIQYTYVITGRSILPLKGPATVSDDRLQVACPEVKTVGNQDEFLDWNENLTCTGSYSITQADLDNHSLTNIAVASAGDVNSEPATITLAGDTEPGLLLKKTARPEEYNSVGEVITYTYVITNNGNVTLSSPFTITDDHIDNGKTFNCETDHQQLASNESITCTNTRTYTISQADFNFENSSVTNNASASGVYRRQPILSPTVTATVVCPYPPERWIPYIVETGETLSHISTWYQNITVADLLRENCMGLVTDIFEGQTLYVPGRPPLSTISGFIRDTQGQPLKNTPVTLINVNTGAPRTIITGAFGEYTFSGLEPGVYRIFQVTFPLLRRGDHQTQDFVIIPVPP